MKPALRDAKIAKALGTGMVDLVGAYLDSEDDNLALGKVVCGLMEAGVKAAFAGRQTKQNLEPELRAARRAVARALARKVKEVTE